MEGKKILCYPDRLHGRMMWELALGACPALLSWDPASSSQGTVPLPRQQCHTRRCPGKHHPTSKLGQCQNKSEAPQQWIHWGLGWCLLTNSKNRKKRGLAAPLPESRPVLTGKGMEMARTIPKPQISQGEKPGGSRVCDSTCDRTCTGASPRGNEYGFMSQGSAPY